MEPPFEIVRRIHCAAAKAVPNPRGYMGPEPILGKQHRLRQVAAELERRLKAAGIYVEGAGD